MKNKIITLTILSSLSLSVCAQNSNTSNIEVSADVNAGCNLTAGDINFGILMMPLTNQSSQSNLNIKCSNNAAYEISIAFGQSSSSGGDITILPQYKKSVYLGDRVVLSDNIMYECRKTELNKVHFWGAADANKLGINWIDNWNIDTVGLCNSDGTANTVTLGNLGYGSSGFLTGISSGENIIYSLEHPTNSNPWTGANKYESVGNGEEQVVAMKANIKSADNPKHRMTPDIYQSTLTVSLIY